MITLDESISFVIPIAIISVTAAVLYKIFTTRNIKTIYQWADLISTVAIAGLAFYGFKNKELAEIIALCGALIVATRIAFTVVIAEMLDKHFNEKNGVFTTKIESLQKEIKEIEKFVDFHVVEDLQKIDDSYRHITDDIFYDAKKTIIDNAYLSLNRLSIEKRANDLNSTDYYKALFKALDSAHSNSKIYGISFLKNNEWDDSEQEKRFIKKQVEAAERGAITERVFIYRQGFTVGNLADNPAIALHSKEIKNNIHGYTVEEKNIPKAVRNSLGNGFIIISDKAILFDSENIDDPTELVGHVCTDKAVINQYIKHFRDLDSIRSEFAAKK